MISASAATTISTKNWRSLLPQKTGAIFGNRNRALTVLTTLFSCALWPYRQFIWDRPMTNTTTKIELVTEAIESLVMASVVALNSPDRKDAHLNVVDARDNVSYALKELLKPTLRVLTNDAPLQHIPAPDARPA
jgi:hypothetical protein